jgi:uncharacterized protein (DUF2225 family)
LKNNVKGENEMPPVEPLYDKNYECLFCKKSFTSKKLRSRFVKLSHTDTDFFPVYESEESNPLYYHILVCPFCGFSFSEDFSRAFPPGAKEVINHEVQSRWVRRDFSGERNIQQAIQTYMLAIYCGSLKKEKHIVLAGMYMRIGWLYRVLKNPDQEQRFMRLAIKEYEDSLYHGDYTRTQVSEIKILYLIGELSQRLNDRQKAVQYFSKVIEKQKQTVEPQIIKMARERWHEIRDREKGI